MTIAPMEKLQRVVVRRVLRGGFRLLGCGRVGVRQLEDVGQIEGFVRLDDEPDVGVVHVNFADRDERRIQVRADAVEAERIPFDEILAQLAVHGMKIFEARITVEGNDRQAVDLRAQPHGAVEIHRAAKDEQIQLVRQIRVERGEIEVVEIQLHVGHHRLKAGGGLEMNRAVGVPAERKIGGEIGAGHIGKILCVERDVAQVELRRARVGEVLQMNRAIRHLDIAHRAAPFIRAVEEHRDGVGDRAQQKHDSARRICRCRRLLGKFHDIYRRVCVAIQ